MAQYIMLLKTYSNLFLIASVVSVYLVVLALSWTLGITILPIVALLVVPVLYLGIKSIGKPLVWLFFIIAGTYAGNSLHLLEGFTLPFSLFQIFFLSGLFLLGLNRIYTGRFQFRISGLELELGLFSALMYMSIIYSPYPEDGLLFATRAVVTGLLLYFILNVVEKKNELVWILVFTSVLALVLAILSVRDGLMNTEAAIMSAISGGRRHMSRAATTQDDPNIFATYFFLPIAFCSTLLVSKSDWRYRLFAGILLPALILGLLSTYSRSSWVSVIIMLILIAVVFREFKIFLWLGILGVLALILLPDMRVTAFNLIQRFGDIFAGSADDSSRIRVVQLYAALQMFADSHMLGVGMRGFADAILNYHSYQDLIGIIHPHNVTYTILAELGLIGFMLFLFIIYRITRDSYLNIKFATDETEKVIATSLFAALVAFFIFYQFIGGGLPDNNVWLIIGLTYATKHVIELRLSTTVDKLDPV